MSSAQAPISAAASPEPLHHPERGTRPQHPGVSVGSHPRANPSLGQKALLSKKMASVANPSTISPTDKLMTPVTAKLSQAKKKHFTKIGLVKPLSFAGSKLADDND